MYIGNAPQFQEFPYELYSGDGSKTDFDLSFAVPGPSALDISIYSGVQDLNAYQVLNNGKLLRFYEAPPAGTANIFVRYKGLLPIAATYAKMPLFDYNGNQLFIQLSSNMSLPFVKADGSTVNIPLSAT